MVSMQNKVLVINFKLKVELLFKGRDYDVFQSEASNKKSSFNFFSGLKKVS